MNANPTSRHVPRRTLLAALLLSAAASAQGGQTVFVTTIDDVTDFGGAQTVADLPGGDGRVSMREATIAVNNTPGPQTIGFQIPTNDWGLGTVAPRIENGNGPWSLTDPGSTRYRAAGRASIWTATQTSSSATASSGRSHEVMFLNVHSAYLGSSFFYVPASGCTLPGVTGAPLLVGSGSLQPGSQMTLSLSNGYPLSTGGWVIGYAQGDLPFAGGVIVPSLDHVLTLTTDGSGHAGGGGKWWVGAPSGWQVYFQAWMLDFTNPQFLSASNALVGTTP